MPGTSWNSAKWQLSPKNKVSSDKSKLNAYGWQMICEQCSPRKHNEAKARGTLIHKHSPSSTIKPGESFFCDCSKKKVPMDQIGAS